MNPTPASAANERDRQEFETWARTADGNCNENDLRKWGATAYQLTEDGETYVDALVERDWTVWQAARAIPQPAAEPSPLEAPQVWSKEADMVASWERGMKSAAEPVAWLYKTPMPDGSVFSGASVERLTIGIGVTVDSTETPLYSAPTIIIREPTLEERHAEGVAKLMASAGRFNSDRAASAGSAILERQVSDWRKEVARLQDLIDTATGSAGSVADARVLRLLNAAKVYAFNYCQDEAESEEDCVCGAKQHAEAVELFAAIAAMPKEPTNG